mmetsp:Transcript_36615/g.86091  ORF Transcript_36615/g.86091 Transcript_36615/m.86091 type:complete len:150 (+) Transcript_36615:83-532(+)
MTETKNEALFLLLDEPEQTWGGLRAPGQPELCFDATANQFYYLATTVTQDGESRQVEVVMDENGGLLVEATVPRNADAGEKVIIRLPNGDLARLQLQQKMAAGNCLFFQMPSKTKKTKPSGIFARCMNKLRGKKFVNVVAATIREANKE